MCHRVPCPHPRPLLTFLPMGHGLLALPEHAEEAVGAVGVPAAVLPRGAPGQAQPEVLVAEVPVGAGGARAARCHLGGRMQHIRGPNSIPDPIPDPITVSILDPVPHHIPDPIPNPATVQKPQQRGKNRVFAH